jgi:hypothetical protein
MYVVAGTTKRLNLTAEDQARVAFKDPIQGATDAKGQCRFSIDPNNMHPNHGTLVGEWNVETCAGLVYSFGPASRPPKGKKHEHVTISKPS